VKFTRIVVSHYGGPEALQVVEDECPEPKRGEVRVKSGGRRCLAARRIGARGRSSRDSARALHAGLGLRRNRRSTR